jgi:hypothetical protein
MEKCLKRTEKKFNFKNGPDPRFQIYNPVPGFIANNAGNIRTEVYKGLFTRFIIQPFYTDIAAGNSVLDHVKFLEFTDPLNVPPKGKLIYELTLGGQINQPAILPNYVLSPNDPRTGSLAMVQLTLADFLIMDILMTNDAIYAFYERLPFGLSATRSYSVFSSFYKLQDRQPNDVHQLQMVIDNHKRTLTWSSEKNSVTVDHPGLQPGKVYENGKSYNNQFTTVLIVNPGGPTNLQTDTVVPQQVQIGFGAFTLMDMAPFVKHNDNLPGYIRLSNTDYLKPTQFLFDKTLPPPTNCRFSTDPNVVTVYGQGAVLDIYEAKVVTEEPSCRNSVCIEFD